MRVPKIVVPINIVDTLGCVYKLHYGSKYIVVMGKSMYRSIWTINDDIIRYFKGISKNLELNKNQRYSKFYFYMVDNPVYKPSIEMVISTDNPYQLLKHCQIELDKGKLDDNCLNDVYEPYIPKDMQKPLNKQNLKWKWISRGSYLNFLKWKSKRLKNMT